MIGEGDEPPMTTCMDSRRSLCVAVRRRCCNSTFNLYLSSSSIRRELLRPIELEMDICLETAPIVEGVERRLKLNMMFFVKVSSRIRINFQIEKNFKTNMFCVSLQFQWYQTKCKPPTVNTTTLLVTECQFLNSFLGLCLRRFSSDERFISSKKRLFLMPKGDNMIEKINLNIRRNHCGQSV